MARRRTPLPADLSLVLLACIWGVNFSVVKVVLEVLDPLAFNALRFPLAALALGGVVARRGGRLLPDRADLPRILALGLLGNVVYQLCFVYGLDWTLAGNASLLLATTPVWTVILSAGAGHERPSGGVVLGVGGTLAGMALVVLGRGDGFSLGSQTVRGDLLMVGAAMLWSVYTVAGRGPIRRYGPLRTTTWTLWVGTPILVLMGAPSIARTDLGAVPPAAWAGVVYAGLFSIGLAYLIWYHGVQRLGNSRTAVYSNLVPVAALATAWVWLGEVPTALQLLGAAVILLGLSVARGAQPPEGSLPDPNSPAPRVSESSSARWRISGNS
jgi:drug/metabolite transporter (DMT)-like permease